MKKFQKSLIWLSLITMVFTTVIRFQSGNFDPYTEDAPEVWSNGPVTKILSFQHAGFFAQGNVDNTDNPAPAFVGFILMGLTIALVIFLVSAPPYTERSKINWALFGLVAFTAMRLLYWVPYTIALV